MPHPTYEAPRAHETGDKKLGWAKEAAQEGRQFLETQPGYNKIDPSVAILLGLTKETIPKGLSQVSTNRAKRMTREYVAFMSKLRPMWGYKTDNPEFGEQAVILNKLLRAWWFNSFADRGIRSSLQYAAGEGTGYAIPLWEKDYWTFGRGDIKLSSCGAKDILPVQVPRSGDLQQAYAVTCVAEIPLNKARRMFPYFADKIQPDRSSPSFLKRGLTSVQRFLSPVLQMSGHSRRAHESNFPVVDVHYTYILDISTNTTGKDVLMGEPGTSWHYTVPSIGAEVRSGRDRDGNPTFRKAHPEDALLYPLRRLMIWTKDVLIYDDTSYFWHGKVPVVPFRLDDWVWSFLGFPIPSEIEPIQSDNNRLMRAISDAHNARLRPPIAYDTNIVSKNFAGRFDPRQGGQQVGFNLGMGDPIKTLLDPKFYEVSPQITDWIASQEQRMDYQIGMPDIAALARARALPAGDNLEKFFELVGPIIEDSSRNMERSLRDIGEMWKGLAFQFYSTKRKVQMLGDDGVSETEFDFEPGTMIPSHMPGEDADQHSEHSALARAKAHQNNFYMHIVPRSLHEITQVSRKLLYLQMYRAGFPIDPWTMAEIMDIENFGDAPTGAQTVMERWVAWKRMEVELRVDMERLLQEAAQSAQGQQGTAFRTVLEDMVNPTARGTGGRPPSGQKSPTLKTKDGGSRTTITES